jgi:hypothetical protein
VSGSDDRAQRTRGLLKLDPEISYREGSRRNKALLCASMVKLDAIRQTVGAAGAG